MSAGAHLIYSLVNETVVTSNNRALPTASQPACYQLVPSLCLCCILHSCAWVGSQLDHDPAQIYAPVYLSALETICGVWMPLKQRSPRQEGRCRRRDALVCPLSPTVPRVRGGQPGDGARTPCWQSTIPGHGDIAGPWCAWRWKDLQGVVPSREVLGQPRTAEGTKAATSFPEGMRSPEVRIV